jgi:hypothetical protein
LPLDIVPVSWSVERVLKPTADGVCLGSIVVAPGTAESLDSNAFKAEEWRAGKVGHEDRTAAIEYVRV